MTLKTCQHIAVQIVALAAQTLVPSLPLSAEARAWVVPFISFIQGALAIVALFSESPTGGNPSSGSKLPPPSGGAGLAVLVCACAAFSRFAWRVWL